MVRCEEEVKKKARVVVCGGGIMGLSTSYYLSKLGHEVLCLDRNGTFAEQTSRVNGAFLDPSLYTSWASPKLLKKAIKPFNLFARKNPNGGLAAESALAATEKSAPPTGIKLRVFGQLSFWNWGVKFLCNSMKEKKSDYNSRLIRKLGFYSMAKMRQFQQEISTLVTVEQERVKNKLNSLTEDEAAKQQRFDSDVDLFESLKEDPSLTYLKHLQSIRQFAQMRQGAFGTLEVFKNTEELKEELESDRLKHVMETKNIKDIEYKTADEAMDLERSLNPSVFQHSKGALFSPSGANGDVLSMCQALHEMCVRQGVMFRYNTEVSDFLVENKKVLALETTCGDYIEGDAFVLALGNDTPSLAQKIGVKLPMVPIKGYLITVPINEGFTMPKYNIYAGGRVLISPLKDPNVIRISGGADFNGNDLSMNKKRTDWLFNEAKKLFPEGYFDESQMTTAVGLRPVSADDVPFIGPSILSNLYINTGHGSKGWTLGFGSSALLADFIDQKHGDPIKNVDNPNDFGVRIEDYSAKRFQSYFSKLR